MAILKVANVHFTQSGNNRLEYANGVIKLVSNNGLQVPSGNTAERPSSNVPGTIRYNNETGSFEGWNATAWGTIGGSTSALGSAAFDQANIAYTQANVAYSQGNTVFGVANAAYNAANAASGGAVISAFNQANTAYSQANAAYAAANSASGPAIPAFNQANTAYTQANTGYNQANTVFGVANAAFGQANGISSQATAGRDQANVAYSQANTVFGVANAAFLAANSIYNQANVARDQANVAYSQANTVFGVTNSAFLAANSIYNQANVGRDQANVAYSQANTVFGATNSGFTAANAAYNRANNANIALFGSGVANDHTVLFGDNNWRNPINISVSRVGTGSYVGDVTFSMSGRTLSIVVTHFDGAGPPPPPPAGGDGCFLYGSLILMANRTWKPIQDVIIGDLVMTLTGVGKVLKTPKYTLGYGRSIVALNTIDKKKKIMMSDDHSVWTMFEDKQWWGTYNYSHYLWEMNNVDNNNGEGPQLEEHSKSLIRGKYYLHATDEGFMPSFIEYHPEYGPETSLYHLIVDKGSYIVDGFVMSSSPKDEFYKDVDWKGIDNDFKFISGAA